MNHLTPFRFWAQKVLPTEYDDSLSYYEVLGKAVAKLNDVIDATNTLESALVNEYDSTTVYHTGYYAWYDNGLYKANKTTTGTWKSSDWNNVVFTDSVGRDIQTFEALVNSELTLAEALINNIIAHVAEPYDETTVYYAGDYVSVNGIVYKCNGDTSGTFDPDKWDEIVIVDELANYVESLWNDFITNYQETLGVSPNYGDSNSDAITQKTITQITNELNCLPLVFLKGSDTDGFVWDGYWCNVSQNTESVITNNMYNVPSSLPNGMEANKKYAIYLNSTTTNIQVEFLWFITGSENQTNAFTTTTEFTVPDNARGCVIRIKALGSSIAYTGKIFCCILEKGDTNKLLYDYTSYNTESIKYLNNAITFESGSFGSSRKNKIEQNSRIRNSSPIPLTQYKTIRLPTGYTMYVFFFDKDMNLVGTSPATATGISTPITAYAGRARYANFQITKTGSENDDISSFVSAVQSGTVVNLYDNYLEEKIGYIETNYPETINYLNQAITFESGAFNNTDRKTKIDRVERIRNTKPIPITQYQTIKLPDGYTMYAFLFDQNMNLIGNTPGTSTGLKMPLTGNFAKARYANFQITKTGSESVDITSSIEEVQTKTLTILNSAYANTRLNNIAMFGNNVPENDYRNTSIVATQGTFENASIVVASYNVANWVHNHTSENLGADKIFGFRNLFANIDADFLCIQEDAEYIDNASSPKTQTAKNFLLEPVFPVETAHEYVSIKSRKAYSETNTLVIGGSRLMNYGVYSVNSKNLLVISAHPTGGTDESAIDARALEYADLFDWIAGTKSLVPYGVSSAPVPCPAHDYLVICGDFNSSTDDDKAAIAAYANSNSLVCANGGRLGWLTTTPSGSSIDNIICSNNIIIGSTKVLTQEGELRYEDNYPLSDHYMMLCKLYLN